MRESGLAELLPLLPDTVYVGLSAGSLVMTPASGRTSWVGSRCPENTMAEAERWAAGMAGPAYAIDEQTAIKGGRRCRRSGFRGPLEAVQPDLMKRPSVACLWRSAV
ncbi:hypothetical protein [Streptomyces sp. NPDC059479]|uniref:hypothetical protein n=1 Tax=Streptomyces sp. NPDC059479 TaxID=3346848 RepID=UPI0036770260